MAFFDEMIRAIVKTGMYTDPQAEQLLADVLIQRRDKIGQTFLAAINPIINLALDASGVLTFENAAVSLGGASQPSGGYLVSWMQFDNNTGGTTPLGLPTAISEGRAQAPRELRSASGTFVKVQISAINPTDPSWTVPVDIYFRRSGEGWTLVGLERLP